MCKEHAIICCSAAMQLSQCQLNGVKVEVCK